MGLVLGVGVGVVGKGEEEGEFDGVRVGGGWGKGKKEVQGKRAYQIQFPGEWRGLVSDGFSGQGGDGGIERG